MTNKGRGPWAAFSAELRRLRTNAGLTQVKLGKASKISSSMLSAVENGTRPPKRDHAEVLDTALSTGGRLTRLWLDINDTLDVPGWWRNISLLERSAVEICEYQMTMIPGLMQTSDYARTSMRLGRHWDAESVIDRDVEARTTRLSQLKDGANLWFVVDEFALTRIVGSRQIMADQLDHVLKFLDEEKARLQVISHPAPQHPGMSGPFRVLDFADRSPVALVEHLVGEEIFQESERVRTCRSLFGSLQAEALSPAQSAKMVRKIREDYKT